MTDEKLKKLVDNYQPDEKTLASLQNIRLLAVVGPTGAGKTSLMHMITAADTTIKPIGGETSRHARQGETTWEFNFVTKDKILKKLENRTLVQIAMTPNDDLYSSSPENYPDEGTGVMAILSSVIPFFRTLPFKKVISVFIVPANYKQWLKRLDERNMSPHERQKRLEEACQSYGFALNDNQTKFILNDELAKAAQRLLQVIRGQTPDNEAQARTIASTNYAKLLKLLNK